MKKPPQTWCDDCERFARVKEAGAKLAAGTKRGGITSVTVTTAGGSVTLDCQVDTKRLRDEAAYIRATCPGQGHPPRWA